MLDHMPIAGRVVPGKMVREDYPMYPPKAFREAVANAICHRDYAAAGGSVAIAIYDNHLEVINAGRFHFDITPEKLIIPHESKPWNPLVAQVFYRAGIIEKWGTGTLNILDWCKENRNPHPKWEERTGSVVMTFYPSAAFSNKEKRPKLRLESGLESGLESNKISLKEQVVEVLLSVEALSTSEIAKKLGHSSISSGLRKTLNNLLKNKTIELTIPEKKGSRMQKYKIKK